MNHTEFSSFQTLFIYLYKFHRIKGLGKFKWSQKVMKAVGNLRRLTSGGYPDQIPPSKNEDQTEDG